MTRKEKISRILSRSYRGIKYDHDRVADKIDKLDKGVCPECEKSAMKYGVYHSPDSTRDGTGKLSSKGEKG